jgi:CheY-like chemotaxis protein
MLRVLVVDDEATLRKNTARSLRRAGFEAITAADGVGARQAHSAKIWPSSPRRALSAQISLSRGSACQF